MIVPMCSVLPVWRDYSSLLLNPSLNARSCYHMSSYPYQGHLIIYYLIIQDTIIGHTTWPKLNNTSIIHLIIVIIKCPCPYTGTFKNAPTNIIIVLRLPTTSGRLFLLCRWEYVLVYVRNVALHRRGCHAFRHACLICLLRSYCT